MVRFSDMLGGSGEPEDGAAAESPYAALVNDEDEPEADDAADTDDEPVAVKEAVPMSTFETPEAVLDRLTQYATSARAAEPPAPAQPAAAEEIEPEPEAEEESAPEPDSLSPVGDDFLPKVRGITRRGRGRKRHP